MDRCSFAKNAYDFELDPVEKEQEKATRALMIAELEKMDTDVARTLIAQMKNEKV